jgi:uncharacterized protein YjbI with pentapeptide repeats
MTAAELQEALRLHRLWIDYDPEGVRANLSRADLRRADLSWADLRGADLSWADLRWADLRGADLREANLRWADLRRADLRRADLSWADLRRADLREASLREADLREADLREAKGLPITADAPSRLQAVAAQVLSNPDCLRMNLWHSNCGTTHCLAGWAIHQAGPIGATLEALHGAHLAGLLLLGHDAAARFYQSNDEVLQWLRTISEAQP